MQSDEDTAADHARSGAAGGAAEPDRPARAVPPGHYRSNLRDLEFVLFELLGRDSVLGADPYAALDADTARAALAEVARLAEHELAASFRDADRNPPTFDPATGEVRVTPSFAASYRAYRESEWWRFDLPAELGGTTCPPSLRWAVQELVLGANPAIHMYGCGAFFASVLAELGTPEQRALAELMVERGWGASMALTEDGAGSDVGAVRLRATPQPDGSWHLEGTKRFITNGEHDLAENIVHFVLARPDGAEPGIKGLSLFVVPRNHVDPATREPGPRNGIRATSLEDKLGLRASATCELVLGGPVPAVGHLLGDRHDGIAQMFRLIEDARMMVGTKSMAALSSAYLGALEHARTRVQGRDLARRGDRTAPTVPIVDHPDVRRLLLGLKAQAEGLRALVLYTAAVHDEVHEAGLRGTAPASAAAARHELLLPLVKGYGAHRATELLPDAIQVVGGEGYLRDHPYEQYLRDTRIDTIYEGTTGIQGLDLFFRKVIRDDARAVTALLDEIAAFADSPSAADPTGANDPSPAALSNAVDDLRAMLATLCHRHTESATDPATAHQVGEHTTALLLALGDLVVAWLLLRSAQVARRALAADPTPADRAFYEGKLAAARWFTRTRLPTITTARTLIDTPDPTLTTLDPDAL